jgi:hypothetical protein
MRLIFVFFLALPTILTAQVSDDFSDGDFLNNPQWNGSVAKFEVTSSGKLHLNAPAEASEAWLFTSSNAIENSSWEIDAEMLFDPSSANYFRFYLAADASDPVLIRNGYFVMAGGTEDEVSLYRLTNGNASKIIDGMNGRLSLSSVRISIRVVHAGNSRWELGVNLGNGWIDEGQVDDAATVTPLYCGVYCKYSATRSTLFYFDNILVTGQPITDVIPPTIIAHEVQGGDRIKLLFSEPLKDETLQPHFFEVLPGSYVPEKCNYFEEGENRGVYLIFNPRLPDIPNGSLSITSLADRAGNVMKDSVVAFSYERIKLVEWKVNGSSALQLRFSKPLLHSSVVATSFTLTPGHLQPSTIVWKGSSELLLQFDSPFVDETSYSLQITGVSDEFGEQCLTNQLSFVWYIPKRFDLVFSELMIDPEPPQGLPADEYIEVFNRSNYDISLEGFSLSVNSKSVSIGNQVIGPGEFRVLISDKSVSRWLTNPYIVPVKGLSVLTNESGELVLFSPSNTVMDALRYNKTWKESSFKDDGGWSFERMDMNNQSGFFSNWGFTLNHEGGTPGMANSISRLNPDYQKPVIRFVEMPNDSTVWIHFSEEIRNLEELNRDDFSTHQPELYVDSLAHDPIFCSRLLLRFNKPFPQYPLTTLVPNVAFADFAGNALAPYFPLTVGGSSDVQTGDLGINELMFNPISGGADFIEVYNRSQKVLRLCDLFIASVTSDGLPEKLYAASIHRIPILPGTHWVITPNAGIVEQLHLPAAPWLISETSGFPSMPDDAGRVALTNSKGIVIDRVDYDQKWHFSLLSTREGVSLERINPWGPSQSSQNWHSAASTNGYATPTAQNSQFREGKKHERDWFVLEPKLFTPDSDGTDDLLMINLYPQEVGSVATIRVFDSSGNPIRTVANNALIATNSMFTWDGTNEIGQKVNHGIYVVWVRIFDASGKVKEQKKVCVLGAKAAG